jgi:hypothetical protein
MALKSRPAKPGPRSPWQLRVRYQRSRCIERLKPNQIKNLSAADAFARRRGTPLNHFVTITFQGHANSKQIFGTAIDRLSKWHLRWGGEWLAIHVWEAVGSFHIHMACHCPKNADAVHAAIRTAFTGHDIHIRTRSGGQAMMAYLCKGTDVVTHAKLHGPRRIKARKQGVIPWKRCGTTKNIVKCARTKAGFEAKTVKINCLKTSPRNLNLHGLRRTNANASVANELPSPTYVVSQSQKMLLQNDDNYVSRERVASGAYDASRHALPDSLRSGTCA